MAAPFKLLPGNTDTSLQVLSFNSASAAAAAQAFLHEWECSGLPGRTRYAPRSVTNLMHAIQLPIKTNHRQTSDADEQPCAVASTEALLIGHGILTRHYSFFCPPNNHNKQIHKNPKHPTTSRPETFCAALLQQHNYHHRYIHTCVTNLSSMSKTTSSEAWFLIFYVFEWLKIFLRARVSSDLRFPKKYELVETSGWHPLPILKAAALCTSPG